MCLCVCAPLSPIYRSYIPTDMSQLWIHTIVKKYFLTFLGGHCGLSRQFPFRLLMMGFNKVFFIFIFPTIFIFSFSSHDGSVLIKSINTWSLYVLKHQRGSKPNTTRRKMEVGSGSFCGFLSTCAIIEMPETNYSVGNSEIMSMISIIIDQFWFQ